MTLEAVRTAININGVSVPGVNRDGLFIGEQPINTFVLFKTGSMTAGSSKSFLIDFPITPKAVIINDTTTNNTYTFNIVTADNVSFPTVIAASQMTIYGNAKVFTFPSIVWDKGTRISVNVTNAIQAIQIFGCLAYNVDIRDF